MSMRFKSEIGGNIRDFVGNSNVMDFSGAMLIYYMFIQLAQENFTRQTKHY